MTCREKKLDWRERNMKSIKQEMLEHLINQLIDHPEFNREKFLKTNPQLKEVVEKAIKEREDRKKFLNEQQNS